MGQTERVGVSLDKKLLSMFDELIAAQGYSNRSEAIRDLIRNRLSEERLAKPTTRAVAGVFLVYDHHSTELSRKLVDFQHSHLLQVIASTHVHLDHHNCLESIVLKGTPRQLRRLADAICATKGVRMGKLTLLSGNV